MSVALRRGRASVPRSVTGRFRMILFLVFGGGTVLALALAWTFSGSAADEAYDRLLQSAAVQLLDGVRIADGQVSILPPESAFDTLALAEQDRFFYAVRQRHGPLLTGYGDLPALPAAEADRGTATGEAWFRGAVVRLLTLRRPLGVGGQGDAVEVTVAQTREARAAMRMRLFLRQAPVAAMLSAIGLLASLLAARLALRPLVLIEATLRARPPQDLSPLEVDGPRETEELVAAINALVGRLAERLDKLQAFAGLIAHQLRTPLAALGAQLDLLANEVGPERRSRVDRLRLRLAELNRLVHQLLGHAMIAYRGDAAPRRPVDVVDLARAVALDAAAGDAAPGGEIVFEAPAEPIWVPADPVMLQEALANLVSNARRHGGPLLKIGVVRRAAGAALTVADDGPGMAESAWRRAMEPFAVARGDGTGAGLGLSIACEAARMHGGDLRCGTTADGLFEVAILIGEPTR